MIRLRSLWFAVVISTACASELPARKAATDPANPAAPESPPPRHPSTLDSSANLPPPAVASTATHACPMHPDVTGSTDERCSKCGMKLERLADKKAEGQHHAH